MLRPQATRKHLRLVRALAGEHSAAPRAIGSGVGTNERGVLCCALTRDS